MFSSSMALPAPIHDDVDLVRRAAAGDGAAVLSLYDRHAPSILALAIRILGSRDEAEEVVQESFVRVWQDAAGYDPARAGFRAWICTIARNRALDLLRRRGTAHRARADIDVPEASVPPDVIASDGESAAKVRAALASLPEAQRKAIELAYYEGLTHVEIASRTKTPLGTVKTRILDGMRKLRGLLEGGAA
jgi:RNA polymerase sigma-70 factor (ECF subfamily)